MDEGNIHVLKASSCYSWKDTFPFVMQYCYAVKTKKGIWSLYNRIVLLIGCIVLFKEAYPVFLLLYSRMYLWFINLERSAVILAEEEHPGFRQMPIKSGKPIASAIAIAEHRGGYLLEFTLECKCCCKGLRLLAKEQQGKASTWGAQVWHSWTASSLEYHCAFLQKLGVADN